MTGQARQAGEGTASACWFWSHGCYADDNVTCRSGTYSGVLAVG